MKFRLNFVLGTLLVVLVATFENAEGVPEVYPGSRRAQARARAQAQAQPVNPGEPLFLTPLIERGQLERARSSARVDPLVTNLESYSGFLTVNKQYNSNLFFWYFPAKVNAATAPVVLYLEGGPGATTFFGLLLQHGPFSVSKTSTLVGRAESWNNNHNVIYIDNPVGTGYSFTENDAGYPDGQIKIGDSLRIALVQFFKMFPHLRANDFYVTGESYAGKMVPAVSNAIHEWNPTTTTDKINLKGMAIANGYTDPKNQLVYGEFLYQIGMIDANGRDQFLDLERRLHDKILQHNHAEAYTLATQLVDGGPPPTLFKNLTGHDFIFNYLEPNGFINVDDAYAWVQKPEIRRALHVGNRPFTPYSAEVANHLKNDATHSQADLVEKLLEHYRVLLYTGQLDIVCSYSGVQNYVEKLRWSGAEGFRTAPRRQWMHSGKLAGYIKKHKNLIDVLVRLSGHVVSMDQPVWALDLIEKFTRGTL